MSSVGSNHCYILLFSGECNISCFIGDSEVAHLVQVQLYLLDSSSGPCWTILFITYLRPLDFESLTLYEAQKVVIFPFSLISSTSLELSRPYTYRPFTRFQNHKQNAKEGIKSLVWC